MRNQEILDALADHNIDKVLLLTEDEEKRSEERKKRIKRKDKYCLYCGKAFTPTNNRQMFCCKECLTKGTRDKIARIRKERREKREEKQKREVKPIACELCGKMFMPKNNMAKYCGEDCRRKAAYERIKVYREENREKFAGYREEARSQRKRKKDEKKKSMHSIDKIAADARAAGMSYGKYMAMKRLQGERQ